MVSANTSYIRNLNIDVLETLFSIYNFTADIYTEDDGSITLGLNEIDLTENGIDENEAREKLAKSIIEYAEDYYTDFEWWSSAPNTRAHIPYVIKSLLINDYKKLSEMIKCQPGTDPDILED
jgi:hypothetical protein